MATRKGLFLLKNKTFSHFFSVLFYILLELYFSLMSTVTFSECMEIIKRKDKGGNPYPFTVDIYTLNKNSKSGGAIRRFENVKLWVTKKQKQTLGSLTKSASKMATPRRNPMHSVNRTLNLDFGLGYPKTIHIRLIDNINGKKMVY